MVHSAVPEPNNQRAVRWSDAVQQKFLLQWSVDGSEISDARMARRTLQYAFDQYPVPGRDVTLGDNPETFAGHGFHFPVDVFLAVLYSAVVLVSLSFSVRKPVFSLTFLRTIGSTMAAGAQFEWFEFQAIGAMPFEGVVV